MTPEIATKMVAGLTGEICAALGYSVSITLQDQNRPVNFDIYVQKAHELSLVLARIERYARAGQERLQFARGSSS